MTIFRKTVWLAASAMVLVSSMACRAQAGPATRYDIDGQDLAAALTVFAAQSGVPMVASADLVAGRHAMAVHGALTAQAALGRLLAGTGLRAQWVAGAWVIDRSDAATLARPSDTISPPAPAASPSGDGIVVTGTRIHGAAPVGAPLTVIDRRQIEHSGRATVAEILQTVPQNFGGGPNEGLVGNSNRNGADLNTNYGTSINLRGLGATSTLVLIDGSRPAIGGELGTFVDVSMIPAVAIDRIEVLTDGASSVYGSDAVAGVVNMRLRNRFQGLELHAQAGAAFGQLGQQQVSGIAGHRWSDGGVTLAYEYDGRGRLRGSDSRAGTQDLRAFGGPDNRSLYALPANITAADGSTYAVSPAANPSQNLTTADLIAGGANHVDTSREIDLLPSQQTHSLYGAADQQLLPGLSLFARALYAHRRFDAAILPYNSSLTVPTTNPWYVDPTGTDEPITVERDFAPDIGQARQGGTTSAVSVTGGATGELGAWHAEASGAIGQQNETRTVSNYVNYSIVDEELAQTDPTLAFNPFGPNSAALLDAIRGGARAHSSFRIWSSALRIDGPLFALPAGSVKMAVGAEYRHESLRSNSTSTIYAPTPLSGAVEGTPAARHISSFYGEILVPLLGPRTDRLPGRLDLSVSGRIERYSDVGHTANPKVGLSWQPVDGITFRGSYGTSFRAPGFTENIGAAENLYQPRLIPDPTSPTGSRAVLGIYGNAANIGPETARTWTAGFDAKPRAIPGLTASATWFEIDYRNRIGSAASEQQYFLEQPDVYAGLITYNPSPATIASYYALPGFYNPSGIAASAITAIVDGTTRNLSQTQVRGFDVDIGYTHALLGGTGHVDISGTRLLAIDEKLTATAPSQSLLATYANPVKLRLRGEAGWTCGNLDLDAFLNYSSGYRNTLVVPSEHVSGWATVDAQIGYTFPKATPFGHARLALSATNLFDRPPPYMNNSEFDSALAYDPGQASAVGRLITVQATLAW